MNVHEDIDLDVVATGIVFVRITMGIVLVVMEIGIVLVVMEIGMVMHFYHK